MVLSMLLPFAILPLMMVTSSTSKMGRFVNPMWVKVVGWAICAVISGLNIYLLWDVLGPMWVIGGAAVMLGYGVFVVVVDEGAWIRLRSIGGRGGGLERSITMEV